MSINQTLPYNAESAQANVVSINEKVNDPNVFKVAFIGSVQFQSEEGKSGLKEGMISTSRKIEVELELCYNIAIMMKKTEMLVFNGANQSDGAEGTTETTSKWVHNKSQDASSSIPITCMALAPHSTDEMIAVWKEEEGHMNTHTFIVADSADGRKKVLANVGYRCDRVCITEGAGGTLIEALHLYDFNTGIFRSGGRVRVINSSYLINVVIPSTIAKTTDAVILKKLQHLQEQLPKISG